MIVEYLVYATDLGFFSFIYTCNLKGWFFFMVSLTSPLFLSSVLKLSRPKASTLDKAPQNHSGSVCMFAWCVSVCAQHCIHTFIMGTL